MERVRKKRTHLAAIAAIVLLCAGWVQPVLPHSRLPHEPCAAMPCCSGKQTSGREPVSIVRAACHDPAAPSPDARARSSPALPVHERADPLPKVYARALDAHDPSAPALSPHAQAPQTRQAADCSASLCFEAQTPAIIASLEGVAVTGTDARYLPPGDERFSSLPPCRLFRPPIPAILQTLWSRGPFRPLPA